MRQRRLCKSILEFLYPARCPVCDTVLPFLGNESVCASCVGDIPVVEEPLCMLCGKPIEGQEEEYCLDCRKGEHKFIQGRAGFLYDYRMREAVGRFKYQGRKEYADFFARVLCEQQGEWIAGIAPDALVPVPLHPSKLRRRGYNQAELLANQVGNKLDIPVLNDLLLREKNTIPQKGLSVKERRKNLEGAFFLNEQQWRLYRGMKCVIMIDDIYTTGSTIDACAEVLYNAGVKEVFFLCTCTGKGY